MMFLSLFTLSCRGKASARYVQEYSFKCFFNNFKFLYLPFHEIKARLYVYHEFRLLNSS